MTRQLSVGLVQQPAWPDKARSLDASEASIRDLAGRGARLVMLQELHATHYFCQYEDPALFDLAEPLDGPTGTRLAELAAELDIVLMGSLFERRAPGIYHNTAVVYDGAKGAVGHYRKMHIPDDPGFYEKFYFTPGDATFNAGHSGFTPIRTSVGKLGVLVCWDQWYPEAARLMALAGADLLLYPTAIGWDRTDDPDEQSRQLDAWITVQRAHAVANGLPVLVANRTGFEPGPDGNGGIDFWGNSFVCGPQGEYLARADRDQEQTLVVDLDMARSEEVRRIWPYLRDRRVDAYQDLTKRYRD